jgi:hypothetical protein
MIKTKNFNPISDPKLKCCCGSPDCDERSVTQELLGRVQKVRNRLGHGMVVTSGGRCPNHPEQARKSDPNGGDHPKGLGIDIACNGSTRGNIVQAGIKEGFNAIGVAKTFVHLGYRDELPDGSLTPEGHLTMWTYS